MKELTVTSPSFKNDEWIPDKFAGYGEEISPELNIEGITADTVSMVIIMDDLDHPIQPGFNHWVIWNVPPQSVIPEGLQKRADKTTPICEGQGIAFGKHGYHGPKPPFNWCHRYLFTVYLLDTMLEVPSGATRKSVLPAMEGHIIGKGELCGKYQRKHAKIEQ